MPEGTASMQSGQYSLRAMLLWVGLIAVTIGLIAAGLRWIQGRITRIEQDAMRSSIVEYEIDNPNNPPVRLNSDYARRLLGDEIEALKAERQKRMDTHVSK